MMHYAYYYPITSTWSVPNLTHLPIQRDRSEPSYLLLPVVNCWVMVSMPKLRVIRLNQYSKWVGLILEPCLDAYYLLLSLKSFKTFFGCYYFFSLSSTNQYRIMCFARLPPPHFSFCKPMHENWAPRLGLKNSYAWEHVIFKLVLSVCKKGVSFRPMFFRMGWLGHFPMCWSLCYFDFCIYW